jgi:hypothetical protein
MWYCIKSKGKAVPLPPYKLQEERCSSYSFLTSALDGVSGQRHATAPLYRRERTPVPVGWEVGWISQLICAEPKEQIICLRWGSNPGRPVCSETLYWQGYHSSNGTLLFFLHFFSSFTSQLMLRESLTFGSYDKLSFTFYKNSISDSIPYVAKR